MPLKMNEHLTEKLQRHSQPRSSSSRAFVLIQPPLLNRNIRQYYTRSEPDPTAPPWTSYEEIPSSAEVQDTLTAGQNAHTVELVPNRLIGPWPSTDDYLGAHYELTREDAIRPIREAVCQMRVTPAADESSFNGKIGIYDNVHFVGFTTSLRGFSVRVSFSTKRIGKNVKWRQSKRLMPGTIVVLSNDDFATNTIVATVAARSSSATDLDPPELDLFFARAEEVELNPSIRWIMIEAKGSYFEASRHVMLTLQKLRNEPFSLKEHIVQVKADITSPAYLNSSPYLDVGSVFGTSELINAHAEWPESIGELDVSQREALRTILTKRLAIVQGPPGTGKTHVSVQALLIMLLNRKENDPPIVVACQTNHALDQLLRHVAEFEPSFARLGGRSQDQGLIKSRTLHELRQLAPKDRLPGCNIHRDRGRREELGKQIAKLLEPLAISSTAIDPETLRKHGLLTEKQVTTLTSGAAKWVQAELVPTEAARSPFHVWLSGALIPVPVKPQAEDFGFVYEEADSEDEMLEEAEAEAAAQQDDEQDGLFGAKYSLADNFTCSPVPGLDTATISRILEQEQDMWTIPQARRGALYRHLQSRLKDKILELARVKIKAYDEAVKQWQIGRYETDELVLRQQHVIGMTVTGMNKYRGLVASLGCKIILIEEAAETLEAPVIAACVPSLEHLILVGDHKQLRPHCAVQEHEDEPFYLNISLFERLVANDVGMSTLTEQRRMIPEVRRILRPIYGKIIKDHPSVLDRPSVPGMGGINSWFFSHIWPETRDDLMSAMNQEEAAMIVGFVKYLTKNGTPAQDITILTFYNGQRKLLQRLLRKQLPHSIATCVIVVTVDSYQGEENSIVILSLVRSNEAGSIGFLSVDNRICVALSRAKCGFYIFGNALLLSKQPTWKRVIKIMAGGHKVNELPTIEPCRFHDLLPVRCQKHNIATEIRCASDWTDNCGGCPQKCKDLLGCGHPCPLHCHPESHDLVECQQKCQKTLKCGHKCQKLCSKQCVCERCTVPDDKRQKAKAILSSPAQGTSTASSSSAWQDYSKQEMAKYEAMRTLRQPQPSPSPYGRLHDQTTLQHKSLAADFDLLDLGQQDDHRDEHASILATAQPKLFSNAVLVPQNILSHGESSSSAQIGQYTVEAEINAEGSLLD